MQCVKCKTDLNNEEINKKIKCDLCKKQMCQTCSTLSSTEVKVMQLSKKYLKYICPNCNTSDAKIEQDEKGSKIKTSEIVKELRTLKDEMESSISKMKEELILLKESNIELVHLCTSCVDKPMINGKLQNNENICKETPSVNIQKTSSSSLLVNKDRKTDKRYSQETTNKSPHIKMNQNMHVQEESPSDARNIEQTQDEGMQWSQIVKRKRKTKSQIGTGSTQTDEKQNGFEGREEKKQKKIWLFISRVKDSVDEEDIIKYIAKKANCSHNDISVKKLKTYYQVKNNGCYLIGLNPTIKNLVYQANFWPRGVAFSRFDFKKGQHFLDNPKNEQKEGTEENSFIQTSPFPAPKSPLLETQILSV